MSLIPKVSIAQLGRAISHDCEYEQIVICPPFGGHQVGRPAFDGMKAPRAWVEKVS